MRVFTFKVSFSWLFKLCFLESLAKAQVRVWKSKSFFNKKKRFQGDFFHEIKAEIDYFPRTSSPLTLEVSGYTQFHLIDISIERLKSLTLFDWRIQNSPFLIPIRELSGRKTVPTYLFQSSSHISWCLLQKVWVEARGKVMSRSENRYLLNRYIVKAQIKFKTFILHPQQWLNFETSAIFSLSSQPTLNWVYLRITFLFSFSSAIFISFFLPLLIPPFVAGNSSRSPCEVYYSWIWVKTGSLCCAHDDTPTRKAWGFDFRLCLLSSLAGKSVKEIGFRSSNEGLWLLSLVIMTLKRWKDFFSPRWFWLCHDSLSEREVLVTEASERADGKDFSKKSTRKRSDIRKLYQFFSDNTTPFSI